MAGQQVVDSTLVANASIMLDNKNKPIELTVKIVLGADRFVWIVFGVLVMSVSDSFLFCSCIGGSNLGVNCNTCIK